MTARRNHSNSPPAPAFLPPDFSPPPPFNWTAAACAAAIWFGVVVWAASSMGAL